MKSQKTNAFGGNFGDTGQEDLIGSCLVSLVSLTARHFVQLRTDFRKQKPNARANGFHDVTRVVIIYFIIYLRRPISMGREVILSAMVLQSGSCSVREDDGIDQHQAQLPSSCLPLMTECGISGLGEWGGGDSSCVFTDSERQQPQLRAPTSG